MEEQKKEYQKPTVERIEDVDGFKEKLSSHDWLNVISMEYKGKPLFLDPNTKYTYKDPLRNIEIPEECNLPDSRKPRECIKEIKLRTKKPEETIEKLLRILNGGD